MESKTKWFKKRGYNGILKVQITPGSNLAKNINDRLRKELPDRKFMIHETLSRTLGDQISNTKSKWMENNCDRKLCYICESKKTSEKSGQIKTKGQVKSSKDISCWTRNTRSL